MNGHLVSNGGYWSRPMWMLWGLFSSSSPYPFRLYVIASGAVRKRSELLCQLFFFESLMLSVSWRLIGRAYSYHLERRLCTILQTIPHKLFSVLKDTLCPALQRQWEPSLDKNAVSFTDRVVQGGKVRGHVVIITTYVLKFMLSVYTSEKYCGWDSSLEHKAVRAQEAFGERISPFFSQISVLKAEFKSLQ